MNHDLLYHPRRAAATVHRLIGGALLTGLALAAAAPAVAVEPPSAVIIMYHRFGEDRYPSTNVSLEQFEAHLKEMQSGKYHVLPVPQILAALRHGETLPERTIGLTIDDAYLSVYREAWPRLRDAGLPVTLFVATEPVDEATPDYMSWAQIRDMAEGGVTIGSQTVSHLHMAKADDAANRQELARSNARFLAELGRKPDLFAYPYGESSLAVQRVVREAGFVAAFGQHSGAIGNTDNMFDLPRFAMNEHYGDLDRFRLAANALPLPAVDVTPADPLVGDPNPPPMGFTLARPIGGTERLACYASHTGQAEVQRLGDRRIEVRVTAAFPKGRTRVNCTMPTAEGRWRWFGRQFYRPN